MTGKALQRVLQERGVRLRTRGEAKRVRLPVDQLDTAIVLYRDGSSHRAIAEALGSSPGTVRSSLVDAGISFRDRGSAHRGPGEFGRFKDPRGYVHVGLLPEHVRFDMTNSDDYVLEHRLAMALALGRSLTAKETVHHIDGQRDHNALNNLQLRTGHHGQGVVLICADCGSFNIAPSPLAQEVPA